MTVPVSPKALRALVLGALIILAQCFLGAAALAKGPAPEATAVHFYRWYMQSLAIQQDPLRHSPEQMSAYVDMALVNDLKKRLNRKGLHADYLIQAQEFMDDWTTDIRAVRPTVQGTLASVVIILGATPETKRILALTLARMMATGRSAWYAWCNAAWEKGRQRQSLTVAPASGELCASKWGLT